MVVRPENVAFAVDAVSVNRLPYRDFPSADIAGIIEQIRMVEDFDFEVLAPGHGAMGVRADAVVHRGYGENLMAMVKEGLQVGKSVDDLVAELDLSAYASWGFYECQSAFNSDRPWVARIVGEVASRLRETGQASRSNRKVGVARLEI